MAERTWRNFVKIVGTAATATAAVVAAGGTRALLELDRGVGLGPGGVAAAAPLQESWIKTTCALCSSGCGLQVRVVDGRAVKIEGNPLHPVNQGVCCLKGQAALEVLYSPERLRHPRLQKGPRGSGDWQEISWEEALQRIAARLTELRTGGQPESVAFLHGPTRGQMRGLIQRFMTAYGSPNVVALESADEQAARLAMFLAQGINGFPVYDLANARYVLSFGGNLLESSRHVLGYLGGAAFMRRGRAERGKLIAVHPRLGLTGIKADEWVPIRPGTYGALALGLANVVVNSNLYDKDFVRDFTFGFEDFRDEAGHDHQGFKSLVLRQYTLERVSAITGVPAADIARLAGEFASNRPAVAVLPVEPQGLADGHELYSAMAIHALNALVGAIDAPGGVMVQRFPQLAPWPAVTLDGVAHAGLARSHVAAAREGDLPMAPTSAHGVAQEILASRPYPLGALFLYNANPVHDAGGAFAQALLKVPFVVSFASTLDESAAHADLILPASTFLENWGDDYLEGTGFAGISLRQPVVEPVVVDTRNPGDVLLQLAAALGGSMAASHPWSDYHALVTARLAGTEVDAAKLVENGTWSEMVYFHAAPGSPAWPQVVGRDRINAPKDGRFDFFARELATAPAAPGDLKCLPHFELPPTGSQEAQYPLLLISQGLITESTTWFGVIPSLQECYGLQAHSTWESWVEISPRAAASLNLSHGDLVWVESPAGRIQARARIYPGLWPNAVFMPGGQGHFTRVRWGRDALPGIEVGANPHSLSAGEGSTRVRVYKA